MLVTYFVFHDIRFYYRNTTKHSIVPKLKGVRTKTPRGESDLSFEENDIFISYYFLLASIDFPVTTFN